MGVYGVPRLWGTWQQHVNKQFRHAFSSHSRLKIVWEILLPSAVHLEERLTVSSSVSQSLSQASSQSDRNTQFGFFVIGKCGPKQWGDHLSTTQQWPSG